MLKNGILKIFAACLLISSVQLTACKSKKDKSATDTTTTTPTVTPDTTMAPVTVNSDDALSTGVRDATKDFPGVNATVANGEITLTGEITRDRLPTLMAALNTLKPKKINNNLTIK
jgi:hypothetical protein